jgi:hypothetical protein
MPKYNYNTVQTFISSFDSSSSSIPETLGTSTQETEYNFNSDYRCSCHSFSIDPYSFRRPEEFEDCSRADLKRAYRLGRDY